MTLFEGKAGKPYQIRGLYVEEAITRRLEALGLNDGTVIHVLTRKKMVLLSLKSEERD